MELEHAPTACNSADNASRGESPDNWLISESMVLTCWSSLNQNVLKKISKKKAVIVCSTPTLSSEKKQDPIILEEVGFDPLITKKKQKCERCCF